MLTKNFLNSINPLNYPQNDRMGYFKFEDEPIVLHKERANVSEPPKLRFGKDAKAVVISHYTSNKGKGVVRILLKSYKNCIK